MKNISIEGLCYFYDEKSSKIYRVDTDKCRIEDLMCLNLVQTDPNVIFRLTVITNNDQFVTIPLLCNHPKISSITQVQIIGKNAIVNINS